ncbi:hypothetical protein ACFLT7_06100, partial [candidate division KSB1 bacterium]
SWDNPHIPVDDMEEALRTLDPNVFAQEYGAEFTSQAGLVYGEFDASTHVFEKFPVPESVVFEHWDCWAGIDFGFTNPFVYLWCFLSPDGEVYVYDELYVNRQTIPQLAELVRRKEAQFPHGINRWRVRICDPADPGARQQFSDEGIRMVPAAWPINDVHEGIKEVRGLLVSRPDRKGDMSPRVHIHSRCTNTMREMLNYCYPEGTFSKDPAEEPLKRDDHAMDALRYVVRVVNRPPRRIIR